MSRLLLLIIVLFKSCESNIESKRFVVEPSVDLLRLERTVQTLTSNIQNLQGTVSQLQSSLQKLQDRGSTYVRWGRKQCPATQSEFIYSGFASGQRHYTGGSLSGGPANMLCLPDSPEASDRVVPGGSYIYGSQFEESTFAADAYEKNVPCAVCRTTNRTSSVMIPGRKTCFKGWTTEYRGIVASDHSNNKASSYICVDSKPEYTSQGQSNQNDRLLYATRIHCGSLACPPYKNNTDIYCVVCSK